MRGMRAREVLDPDRRIKDVSFKTDVTIYAVLGCKPHSYTRVDPIDGSRMETDLAKLRKMNSRQIEERSLVSGGEHRINPLLGSYISGSKELIGLARIPIVPVINDSLLQNVANSVDTENLQRLLHDLGALGSGPPRMSNILVAANLTCNEMIGGEQDRQYAGNATRDWWAQKGDHVVVEKRLMSLLGLAWRRKYYTISYALHKYDQYAQSGVLRYLGHESDNFKIAAVNCLKSVSMDNTDLHKIITGYMDAPFPHPLDSFAYTDGYDRTLLLTTPDPPLLESVVLDRVAATKVLEDPDIRSAIYAQDTPNDAFQPYQ